MQRRRYTDDYIHMGHRRRLVQLLREKGVSDEGVLAGIARVPRHWFVAAVHEARAYEDRALPIAAGQTISQPLTVALQTTWLAADPSHKILEVGTGSGYQAAVLAAMGLRVYTLERQEDLYAQTSKLLRRQRFGRVRCFLQDGFRGLPAYAPFDRILVTAGVERAPEALLAQLAVGGQMIIPLGEERQVMHRITQVSPGRYETEALGRFRFVPFREGIVRRERRGAA